MMHCEHCDTDMFGGSVCHLCGGMLEPKVVEKGPKVTRVSSDMIMGQKKKLSVDAAQSLGGRLFRLTLEILLFCFLFYVVSLGVVHTINWLSREMAMDPASEPDTIPIADKGFRLFQYLGLLITALLTIKFRFQSGK